MKVYCKIIGFPFRYCSIRGPIASIYDSADQLLSAASTCNNNVLCSGAYSYNNWGKINTYTQQTTDPATNTSENKDYRYYFQGNNADMSQGQTSFAPIIKYDMQQNTQPLETCTYGINGSIRKRLDHPTQSTDYYYFNASGNLKAYGTDMQISVYGYNSANTRTYKVNMFNANQWVNGQPQPIQPMVQSAMFYPNTYLNFTQAGEYTKHYYSGTERICSRLGEQQIPISVENEQELEAYRNDVKQIIYNAIGQHLYDAPTDMQEGDLIPLEFLQATGDNNAIFYYHPNHLSSTMYVTDAQQSVVQSFLYAPYGDIISEYNTHAMGEAFPKYSFNAKELDEETGMYYYEARYYNPPTFISRDPLMSEKPWLTPYHYCSNNPVGRVDPSGCEDMDNPVFNKNGKLIGITKDGGWSGIPIVMLDENDYHKNMDGKAAVKARKAIPLNKYGEGISISDMDWALIEKNGGEKLIPTVENKSSFTIYYKPEGEKHGEDMNPGYSNSGAYPISPNTDLYAAADGIAAPHIIRNEVYKMPDGLKVRVNDFCVEPIKNSVKSFIANFIPSGRGWNDERWHSYLKASCICLPTVSFPVEIPKRADHSWDNLFIKSQ